MKKLLLSLLVFLLTASPVLAAADVSVDDPDYAAVQHLESVGWHGENFYPRRPINLAEFLVLGMLAAGVEADQLPDSAQTRFVDVPAQSWFAPFVSEADRFGILSDFRSAELLPHRSLSRGEAVKLAMQIFAISIPLGATETDFGFSDIDSKHRLAPYVFHALQLGLIEPQSDEVFGLTTRTTRGEAATLFYAAANYSPEGEITINFGGGGSNIPKIEMLDAVWSEIEQKFLFQEKINNDQMLYGAIEGLVKSLGDPYSAFLPPENSTAFNEDLSGELEGIGAYLSLDEKTKEVTIIAPIRGTPADRAGLRSGDVITEVDGKPTAGRELPEVTREIKGARGTAVELTIRRGTETIKFKITREKIEVKSVELKIENGLAVLSVSQFGAKTAEEFAAAATEIVKQNPKGIILDLRNNPGGLLNTAIDMLGYFLPKNSVAVRAHYRSGQDTVYKTERDPTLNSFKTVVLINKGSASASEIVAAALQDTANARLIGQTSFGKGTVQELSFFADGTALKLTIAKWYSPSSQPIHEHGVTPTVTVLDDEKTTADEVLDRARQEF